MSAEVTGSMTEAELSWLEFSADNLIAHDGIARATYIAGYEKVAQERDDWHDAALMVADYHSDAVAELIEARTENLRLITMLYEIGFCPCGSSMPCIEADCGYAA